MTMQIVSGSALLDYDEAAKFLNISKNTLYGWVQRGKVPHVRISSRLVRFDVEDLRRWLDLHKTGGIDGE